MNKKSLTKLWKKKNEDQMNAKKMAFNTPTLWIIFNVRWHVVSWSKVHWFVAIFVLVSRSWIQWLIIVGFWNWYICTITKKALITEHLVKMIRKNIIHNYHFGQSKEEYEQHLSYWSNYSNHLMASHFGKLENIQLIQHCCPRKSIGCFHWMS